MLTTEFTENTERKEETALLFSVTSVVSGQKVAKGRREGGGGGADSLSLLCLFVVRRSHPRQSA